MKAKFSILIAAIALAGVGSSEAREAAKSKADHAPADPVPIIKSMTYGFDALEIVRGLEGKVSVDLSGTFTSKHVWHGLDLLDDHGAFIPVGTVVFGDSGFSAKIIDVYPLSSGLERSVERNYAGFYTGALLEDTPWATEFTTNYYYYGKPKVPGRKADAQEVGSTFFWPDRISVGESRLTPSYYFGYIWASVHNSDIRGCEGFIHVFALALDVEKSNFWPGGDSQAFRFFGDITYNDGFGGSTIDHDWSHAVLGASTNLEKGQLAVTPSLSYQISMDDSVNPENELWCAINFTYRF